MKKLVTLVTITALITLIGLILYNGLSLGKLEILGAKQIKNKNSELDSKIQEATKLASSDYQKSVDELNETLKKLQSTKKSYEEMVSVSTESEVASAIQNDRYPIEYLWIKIGNYADSEGVNLKMQVETSSANAQGRYNLAFTVAGKYIGIEEFITHIEEDDSLGFKIEEFKMGSSVSQTVKEGQNTTTNTTTTVESVSGNDIVATFKCKDIAIEGLSTNMLSLQNQNNGNDSANQNNPNNQSDQNNPNNQSDQNNPNNQSDQNNPNNNQVNNNTENTNNTNKSTLNNIGNAMNSMY